LLTIPPKKFSLAYFILKKTKKHLSFYLISDRFSGYTGNPSYVENFFWILPMEVSPAEIFCTEISPHIALALKTHIAIIK